MVKRTLICALVALSSACGSPPPASRASAAPPRNPLAAARPIDPALGSFVGTVATRIAAGSYVYYKVDDGRRARWVVSAGAPLVEVGGRARVLRFANAEQFVSRRLGRTFVDLDFGAVFPADIVDSTEDL